MVSDTKNKRGRPTKFNEALYLIWDDREKRSAQNVYYAGIAVREILNHKPGDFFVDKRGTFRRQAIAEQIGRIYKEGLLTIDQCRELAQVSIDDYNDGSSTKEIAKTLTALRLRLKKGTTNNE